MPRDLLSDQIGFVIRLDFEAAVVGPEIDRNADAGDAALVNLHASATFSVLQGEIAYHFCCLGPCDSKFHVCISLPEAIE